MSELEYDYATLLYRRAAATAHRAEKVAKEHASTGRSERRLREVDAVIETITFAWTQPSVTSDRC